MPKTTITATEQPEYFENAATNSKQINATLQNINASGLATIKVRFCAKWMNRQSSQDLRSIKRDKHRVQGTALAATSLASRRWDRQDKQAAALRRVTRIKALLEQ